MSARKVDVPLRFWPRVNKTDTCWLWTGGKSSMGYGAFWLGSNNVGAHRISWMLHAGPIPPDLFVCHRCDTPLCVRFDHLFLGSSADNQADMSRKGRAAAGARNGKFTHPESALKGERNGHAKLTDDLVRNIREAGRLGTPQRHIARQFGVSQSQVSNLILRKQWRHAP